MDNTLVSARVPRAKKERGVGVLASIGATTSDLINNAFDYVIWAKELPSARPGVSRAVSAEGFAAYVSESTFEVDWPETAVDDYKRLMAEMRVDDYESLD